MKAFILMLMAIPGIAQNITITSFNRITGYIEIHDHAYFDRLDERTKMLYREHMDYYNIGVRYYTEGEDYEMANFYFTKAFSFGWFSKISVKPTDDVMQTKALYAFLAILKVPKYQVKRGDVVNARQLVDDKCDPEKKRIAYGAYDEWKKRRDKKPKV